MALKNKRIKGGSMAKLREKQEAAKKRDKFNNNLEFSKTHKIIDGTNTFRILQAHNVEDSPYEEQRTVWLDVETENRETGKKEVKRLPIFIGSTHNEALKEQELDIVETYISLSEEVANELHEDQKEKDKYLEPIRGGFKSDYDGIMPSTQFVCYALNKNEGWKLGDLQLRPKWIESLSALSIQLNEQLFEGDEDMILDNDAFTNPETGRVFMITKKKEQRVSYDFAYGAVAKPETEEDREALKKYRPLKDRFVNSYKMRDFEMALDGLDRFDKKHGFGICELDEFQEVAEEIRSILKKQEDSGDDQPKEEPKKEVGTKKESLPSKDEMIEFLEDYIDQEYPDRELPEDLKLSEIKNWYALALEEEPLPFPEESDSDEDEDDEEEEMSAAKKRIAALKAKRNKK